MVLVILVEADVPPRSSYEVLFVSRVNNQYVRHDESNDDCPQGDGHIEFKYHRPFGGIEIIMVKVTIM